MGIISRLKQRSEILQVRPIHEAPDVTGGRDGELLVKQLVGASFQFRDAQLFPGRRIPSKRQGRRREIDLIVCTPRMIHLIEIKNWSGQLAIRDGAWRQTRRSGDVVNHGNLIETNLQKRDAVVEYLADRGLALDGPFVREHIVPKIIFMNPRLELDAAVEARADVISRRELDGYLGRQQQKPLAERMFSSVIEFCLDVESRLTRKPSHSADGRIPRAQYEQIVKYLSETSTWDQLQFFGGKVITGDVVMLKIGPKIYRKQELDELSRRVPLRLSWTRGGLLSLLKAITGLGTLGTLYLGNTRIAVTSGDTLTFHAVGDEEALTRRLVELDRIVLG